MRPAEVTIANLGVDSTPDASELLDFVFPSQDVVWLDSSKTPGGNPDRSRWSIFAGSDGPFSGRLTAVEGVTQWSGTEIHHRLHSQAVRSGIQKRAFAEALDQLLGALALNLSEHLGCPFLLGWARFLGYEVDAPTKLSAGTDAHLLFCDRAVVMDHVLGTTTVMTLIAADDRVNASAANAANRTWLKQAAAQIRVAATRTTSAALPGVDPQARAVSPSESASLRATG